MRYLLITAIIIIVDFITKRCVLTHLTKVDTLSLWEDVFHLTYVENRGAAFGIMQNQKWLFIILTLAVLVVILYLFLKKKVKHPLMQTALSFLAGGAAGNLIDRIAYGYVVDFFDFKLINYPVFNIADIFVVVGAILFTVYIIFFDKSDDKETKSYEQDNC